MRCPPRGPLRLRPGKGGSAALAGLKLAPAVAYFMYRFAAFAKSCRDFL